MRRQAHQLRVRLGKSGIRPAAQRLLIRSKHDECVATLVLDGVEPGLKPVGNGRLAYRLELPHELFLRLGILSIERLPNSDLTADG